MKFITLKNGWHTVVYRSIVIARVKYMEPIKYKIEKYYPETNI